MSTHSPGPWEWVGHDLESNAPGHYESVIEASVSCGQFCYGGSVALKMRDADARLIAASPDLLEALIQIRSSYARLKPSGYPDSDAEKLADAAIAKAGA